MARARRDAPPAARGLETPIGASGLPGASVLRRHGRRMGIGTVGELLTTFPRRYEDLREFTPIAQLADLEPGTPVTLRGSVESIRVERTFRRNVPRTTAVLADGYHSVEVVWFGRRYIERQLKEGDRVVVSGKLKVYRFQPQVDNPEFQRDDGGDLLHAGRIVPVYRLTAGVTARTLRAAIRAGLDAFGQELQEYLGPDLRDRGPSIREAVTAAHFPDDFEQRDAAVRRLAHDELLALQVGMVQRRRQRREERRSVISVEDAVDAALREAIGAGLVRRVGRTVSLTVDQAAAMAAIRGDLAGSVPMLRLIQGDVGSGKTAVAAYAMALAARAGGQGALLAPTDLLARQLAETINDLLRDADLPVTLLTGSLSGPGRRSALEAIAAGQAQVVVGTHALLQGSVSYARLDLVVVDEQHRFGVAQREALAAKGEAPHVLLMTATPIPRTLGQVIYADLDVSDLRTAPAGRPHIVTGVKAPHDLAGTWGQVQKEAAAGHRTFVVVPHIEAQGADEGGGDGDGERPPSLPAADGFPEARGAEEVVARLRAQLPSLHVGLVHGRMRADERDAEMARFRDGQLDVLVGTTVLEVGVDVPEATMMIVLDADRFGLSQLHQLRGRVGRGTAASYCVLVADIREDTVARARLKAIHDSDDGFVLAEQDWRLRGEGDVLGLSQSGLPRMRLARLADKRDQELALRCRRKAEAMLDAHGRLLPEHADFERVLASGWLADIAAGEGADDEGVGA